MEPNKRTFNCKVCGKCKDLTICYDCYLVSMNKWFSEDTGKDMMIRIETKLEQLKKEIAELQRVFNLVLPKKSQLKLKEWETFI